MFIFSYVKFVACLLLCSQATNSLRYSLSPVYRTHIKTSTVFTQSLQSSLISSVVPLLPKFANIRSDPWYIWSLLTMTSTIGVAAEKTNFGSSLSSPLVTMAISLILTNVGLLPSDHGVYKLILKYLVPLAVPLLLLDANLFRCFKLMKGLLKAFVVGALGTVVGTFVAFYLVPMRSIAGSYKVAAALCARHIGGAVNFIAISEILKMPAEIVTATIAADNCVVALYFALLFAISVPDKDGSNLANFRSSVKAVEAFPSPPPAKCPFPIFSKLGPSAEEIVESNAVVLAQDTPQIINSSTEVSVRREEPSKDDKITLEKLLVALSLSFVICTLSQALAYQFEASAILISSVLAVALATLLPSVTYPIANSGGVLGVIFMQVDFFHSIILSLSLALSNASNFNLLLLF